MLKCLCICVETWLSFHDVPMPAKTALPDLSGNKRGKLLAAYKTPFQHQGVREELSTPRALASLDTEVYVHFIMTMLFKKKAFSANSAVNFVLGVGEATLES